MTRPLFRPVGLPMPILAIPTTLAAQGLAPDQTGTGGGPASTHGPEYRQPRCHQAPRDLARPGRSAAARRADA